MKKIIYLLFALISLNQSKSHAQTFWSEDFGFGCNAGTLANGVVATPSNVGVWNVTNLVVPVANGPTPNDWFISATEQGTTVTSCGGNACGGLDDRTLHISENNFPNIDVGAQYGIAPASQTNKRVESPVINCTGRNGIQVSFEYLQEGIIGSDFAELWYFDGVTWSMQSVLQPNAATCPGLGRWEFFSWLLPPSANNNPNVQIGFRWQNTDLAGANPGISIDDILLSTMDIATPTLVLCPQQTVSVSAPVVPPGVTGYTWTSIPPTVTFTTANVNPSAATYPGPGTYTIIGLGSTLPGGPVTATGSMVVTVNPQLAVFAVPINQTVCPGSNATITASGASTYTWSQGVNGPPIATGSAVTVSFPTASVVPYFVQGEVGMCLSNSVIANVTYSNTPFTITVTPQSVSVCPGNEFTVTANGAVSYTWAVPGNPTLTPNGAVFTHTPAASGVFSVTGTQGGCVGNGTFAVSVQNVPLTLTLSPNNATICPGQTVTLNALGATNYTWTPPATLSSSTGISVDASPVVTTTYNVFGEQGGCSGNAQITVTVTQGPNLNINSTAFAVCTGYTSTLTASGAMSYTWTGTTFTGGINQPSISVGSGGYSVIATSTAFACPTLSAVVINTLAALNIGATLSNFTTCITSNNPKYSKPVTIVASGASSYNWAPCNGGNLSICIGPTTIATPFVSTQYTVTGYSSICSGSAVITVSVIPQTTIGVVPPMPITCIGSCLNFSVINTTTALPLPYTYSWTVPSHVPLSIINNLSQTVVACPSVSATYSVELRDANSCVTDQQLVSTTIIPQPLTAATIPTINGVPTNSLCYVGFQPGVTTNTLILTATNTNTGLPFGVVPTYTWYAATTPSNSLYNDGSILTPTSNPQIFITPPTKLPTVRTYSVRSSFNGINGCFREDTVSVRVVDCRRVTEVTFTTTVLNDTICTRQCITYTNTTDAGGPQTFTWNFSGGSPATTTVQVPTVCYNLPGKYNVYLQVKNPYTPAAVQTGSFQFVKVVDVPNTTIIEPGQTRSDTTIRFGMAVNLKGSGATTYAWGPNYMISNIYGPNTTVYPHQSTQYILTGFNSRGCASNDTINVIVIEDCGEMFIPNAFSPNGRDNIENETLKVYGFCFETMTFQVFNRWGQKVFETTDQKIGWDGTFNGEPINSGVFVYRLEAKGFDGKGYSLKGNVTLIR